MPRRDWCNSQAGERTSLSKRQFRVVNANLEGKRLGELDTHRLSQVNISRLQHDGQVVTGTPDVVLHVDDVILAVGADEELEKLRVLVGQEVQVAMAAKQPDGQPGNVRDRGEAGGQAADGPARVGQVRGHRHPNPARRS